MTPVIRIDEEVMGELKRRAIDLGLVFEPPNATLRRLLGLDSQSHLQPQASLPTAGGEATKPAILVISVPFRRGAPGEEHSFETYMQTGMGKGYALSKQEVNALSPGCKVVLLRNDRKKCRAEGTLVKLVKTGEKIPQGIPRYHIFFQGQKMANYSYITPAERLTRRGVKVIDC